MRVAAWPVEPQRRVRRTDRRPEMLGEPGGIAHASGCLQCQAGKLGADVGIGEGRARCVHQGEAARCGANVRGEHQLRAGSREIARCRWRRAEAGRHPQQLLDGHIALRVPGKLGQVLLERICQCDLAAGQRRTIGQRQHGLVHGSCGIARRRRETGGVMLVDDLAVARHDQRETVLCIGIGLRCGERIGRDAGRAGAGGAQRLALAACHGFRRGIGLCGLDCACHGNCLHPRQHGCRFRAGGGSRLRQRRGQPKRQQPGNKAGTHRRGWLHASSSWGGQSASISERR